MELIAFAAPKRAYYIRQPGGRRLIDLKLEGAALAICGASSPEDQALIDATLARVGPAHFAAAFLTAKGLNHVEDALGEFTVPLFKEHHAIAAE
jgi:type IV secretion system protein VirB4